MMLRSTIRCGRLMSNTTAGTIRVCAAGLSVTLMAAASART